MKMDVSRLRRSLRELPHRVFRLILTAWNATDNNDRLVFPGLLCIGVGVHRAHPDAACVVIGVLLVLMGRPLRSWF